MTAILNSGSVLARVIPMQPRGWRDPRDFDNLVWELPIPEYDRRQPVHRELADAAEQAECVAAIVPLQENAHYMRQAEQSATPSPRTEWPAGLMSS